jgi:hypothetical protein
MITDYHKTIHELKTWPQYYEQVRNGSKRFELRRDDRPFAVDDLLILREWEPASETYTGYVTVAVITSIVRGEWLAPGYVALGIAVMGVSS